MNWKENTLEQQELTYKKEMYAKLSDCSILDGLSENVYFGSAYAAHIKNPDYINKVWEKTK